LNKLTQVKNLPGPVQGERLMAAVTVVLLWHFLQVVDPVGLEMAFSFPPRNSPHLGFAYQQLPPLGQVWGASVTWAIWEHRLSLAPVGPQFFLATFAFHLPGQKQSPRNCSCFWKPSLSGPFQRTLYFTKRNRDLEKCGHPLDWLC
jgi:hypothetical protein